MSIARDANRGYRKIEGAARAFDFDFKDKVVLDIGSSTGGFTEYALDHGAKKVIAIEKGSHQMKAPLRFNPRIELHEKTNIFDFHLNFGAGREITLHAHAAPDVIIADFEVEALEMMPDEVLPVEETKPLAVKQEPVKPAKTEPVRTMPEPEPAPKPAPIAQIEPENIEIPAETAPEPEEVMTELVPEEKKPEPIKTAPVTALSTEDILALLVQCTKNAKQQDMRRLQEITNTLIMDRYTANLGQTEILASGDNCILLGCMSQAVANTMNEYSFNRELYFYLKERDLDKMVYAVTKESYEEAVKEFVERRKTNSLPEPAKIERYIEIKEEEGEAPAPEEKLFELFGEDLVEVIDDDE
ncbi:MAG: hypothetical protein IJJ29_02305 [Solobacterium sp.]|nr:hypothetical protein [Solobacterium sp.]